MVRFSVRGRKKEDRISKLPDDILISIISLLKLEEAVRTSVLSHRWMKLWIHYSGMLDFTDSFPLVWATESFPEAMSLYVNSVTRVLDAHKSHMIDGFIVSFRSFKAHYHQIDKWLNFALEKNVRHLVLDCYLDGVELYEDQYCLPVDYINASCFRSLASLSISCVDVTGEYLQCLILNCPLLEQLCVDKSLSLRNLRIECPTLKLKTLKVLECHNMEELDVVYAPNLCCFEYDGPKIQLCVENAPSLTQLFVGWIAFEMSIPSALDPMLNYLSRLVVLHIKISVDWGSQFESFPVVMSSLKQFHLEVTIDDSATVLYGAAAIIMSPVLQKFTSEVWLNGKPSGRELKGGPCVEAPSQSLRELEFKCFKGGAVETELFLFCIKNVAMLQKMIFDRRMGPYDEFDEEFGLDEVSIKGKDRALALKSKLPPSVEFVLI